MKKVGNEASSAGRSSADLLDQILGKKVAPEVLLAQLDALLRHKPTVDQINHQSDAVLAWRGQAAAVLKAWNSTESIGLGMIFTSIDSSQGSSVSQGYRKLIALLHQARHSLQLTTMGPQSVAVAEGKPYHYFEEVRAIVERASTDVFFVDQYLDADFAGRYLPFVPKGACIRLLSGRRYISKLLPAVDVFVSQSQAPLAVRTADFHDRYVFIDGKECHHSGASFKDGGANAPALLVQVTDAFDDVLKKYEAIWHGAKVERA